MHPISRADPAWMKLTKFSFCFVWNKNAAELGSSTEAATIAGASWTLEQSGHSSAPIAPDGIVHPHTNLSTYTIHLLHLQALREAPQVAHKFVILVPACSACMHSMSSKDECAAGARPAFVGSSRFSANSLSPVCSLVRPEY